ncbi:MAG: drug/metabolite exporter YedA [Candidatus Chloroheliales bacterium]|nr:MAG: drug/metabolite exporter YedA [Chloroflexota bacterium]
MEDSYKVATGPAAVVSDAPKQAGLPQVTDAAKQDNPPRLNFGDRFGVLLALLTVYIIWGSTYLGIRFAVQGGFPPFMMAGLRFTIAGVALYLILRARGIANPARLEWRNAAIIGAFLLLGGNGGVTFAEQWVASGLAALAVATVPLWAALFAGLWGRWPSRFEWLGITLGLVGIALLNLNSDMTANGLGALVLVVAPISWAFGTVFSRRLAMPKGLMASALEMIGGGVLLLFASLLLGEHFNQPPTSSSLWAFAYLTIFGSLLAFSAYDYLLRRARPTLITSYAYVNPPVAVLLGAIMAGEQLTPIGLLAMFIILGGVVLIALKPRPPAIAE